VWRAITARHVLVASVLVVVVVLGYAAGHRSRSTRAAGGVAKGQILSIGSALVEYPAGWKPSSAVPQMPALALAHRVLLTPAHGSGQDGLLVGQLPAGEPAPLPHRFTAALAKTPSGEVISLTGLQAYRYGTLAVPGQGALSALYVVPNGAGGPIALGCIVPPGVAGLLRQCEQIIEGVSLVGQAQYDLTPDSAYAARLGVLLSGLERSRVALRSAMGKGATAITIGSLAASLAARFAAAAAAIAALEPPLAAARAQSVLASSMRAAQSAYSALAAGAQGGVGPVYEAALAQIARAEAAVDVALSDFALLGYGAPHA
jgi:hypothetical protein